MGEENAVVWEKELFFEIQEVAEILPPESGVPPGLEDYLNDSGVLVQPIIRRRNYLTNDMCHLNVARSRRPGNIVGKSSTGGRAVDVPAKCPFGPGRESGTPRCAASEGDYARVGTAPWLLRSFPNLYPWLLDHLNIVETPEHKASSEDLVAEEELRALNVASQYSIEQEEAGRFVVLFKNQGVSASLAHFHWQIGSLSYPPVRIAEELERSKGFIGKYRLNIFDAIMNAERNKSERWIGENDVLALFAPFAPRTNHELWIVLKRNVSSLSQTTPEERQAMAEVLCSSVRNLFDASQQDDLFIIIHQLPPPYAELRLHIEIFPVKPWSGAERGFGELVIEHSPEDTALMMRERMHDAF